jgi:hypothetical protein
MGTMAVIGGLVFQAKLIRAHPRLFCHSDHTMERGIMVFSLSGCSCVRRGISLLTVTKLAAEYLMVGDPMAMCLTIYNRRYVLLP